VTPDPVSAVVLAAGTASRFGGGKLLAPLGGRPVLQHVLDSLAVAGLTDVIVVLGHDRAAIEAGIAWRTERRVTNPHPDRGLASSLQTGVAALDPRAWAALVVLGDQPLVSAGTILALLSAPDDPGRPVSAPRYGDDRGRNPVLVRRGAFGLIAETEGDHGLGPVLAAHPDMVQEVPVEGTNPDVDTREDLLRLVETAWADRVRANRDQVDRLREVPDGADFYAPVQSAFRADPTRADDPVLQVLLGLVRSGDRWLDVGAGAGRFALPIARALDPSGGDVVALDPSPSMLEGLREIAEDNAIENIRTTATRWPPPEGTAAAAVTADVVLIAHVGYDIEEIGPFVTALEAAARRELVAVLMARMPASTADAFWPPVHGEARVPLPALADFVELLRARGRAPVVQLVTGERRRFESRDALEGFVRRQLWIDRAGAKEARFQAALDDLAVPDAAGGGWTIRGRGPAETGIVRWPAP
jgi:Uncharacterized MobA-related protein